MQRLEVQRLGSACVLLLTTGDFVGNIID